MTLCVTLGTFNFIEKRANKALKKGFVVTSYLLLVLLAQSGAAYGPHEKFAAIVTLGKFIGQLNAFYGVVDVFLSFCFVG